MRVKPFIDKFRAAENFGMGGLVSVTLKNISVGYSWRIGIMEGYDTLLEGEQMTFNAPSGAIFDETALLQLSPIEPDVFTEGDYPQILVISNKVIDTIPLNFNLRINQ
jgi:hypothetical protein